MTSTNRRIAKYRLMGLAIIVFAIFGMAMGLLLIQEQQQLAISAQVVRTR